MKILPKGLILVGVPLIYGIVFISSLFFGISQTNRLFQSELAVKDAIITFVTAARCSVCAVRYWAVYRSTKNENWQERAKFNEGLAAAAGAHLKTLHQLDPSLPVPSLEVEQRAAILFTPDAGFAKHLAELGQIVLGEHQVNIGALADKTAPLQEICNVQAEDASNAMSFLHTWLSLGIFALIVVSIALAAFFCISITNRLKKILRDTINLAKGLELTSPLKGGDEIAELDRFLFNTAEQLKTLERFKKEMIGIVAQELKKPLYQVGTFLASLRDGVYGSLDLKSTERIALGCTSVQRLIELIGDLFLLDRSELHIEPKTVRVADLISASVGAVKVLLEKSGVRIAVKNSGGTVVADRARLIQVIVNLVSNAMKFSPPNGLITIETVNSNDWFECRIIDQGPGIPESLRQQIFEPFKQVDAKTAIAKKGTGLGLTIARTIVEQHRGTIGVDSEEGQGSTFWFKIPATGLSSSKTPNLGAESGLTSVKIPPMRFSVLKQGLLIISIPLMFHVVFVLMLAGMLNQIETHHERERISQKLLYNVNQAGDFLLEATRYAMVYMYTKESIDWQLFQTELKRAVDFIDQSKGLIADEPEQKKYLEVCSAALARFPSNVQQESSRLGAVYAHDPSGSFTSMSEFMDLIKDPDHPSESLLKRIKVLVTDNVHLRAYEPFFDAQDAMERLISTENTTGERLADQRAHLMSVLNWTLLAGIGLASVLSILLAIFLMRNLIRRVQHVMVNTGRIVNRETLELPNAGGDEITYLDQVVCETGGRLIQLEQFKQSLIGIVSHEIRTPLTAVCITLELLSEGVFGELSPDGTAKLKIVEEEARDLVRLINDLLDLEKMAAGQFVLDKIDFKIGELIEETSGAVIPLAESKHVKVEVDGPNNEMTLCADRDRLCKALVNLVSNRIKSSPEQSKINLLIVRKPTEVEFRVIDYNGGIPDEVRQHMFDRFVQIENPEAREVTGPGLTLVITKAIVEQHGGTIGIDSEIGIGSTFWFKLPLSA